MSEPFAGFCIEVEPSRVFPVKGHADDDGGAGGPAMAREPAVAGSIVVAVNRMPAAEVEVSAVLVRRLLADQHPDLARLPVAFLANGWDNELYRVGGGLVARLPRRALGARIIKNEQRWLPGLAPKLPAG